MLFAKLYNKPAQLEALWQTAWLCPAPAVPSPRTTRCLTGTSLPPNSPSSEAPGRERRRFHWVRAELAAGVAGSLEFEVSQRVAARENRQGVSPVGEVDAGDVAQVGEGDLLDEGDTVGVLVGGLRCLVAGDAAGEVLAAADGQEALVAAAEGIGVGRPGRAPGGERKVVLVPATTRPGAVMWEKS